MPVKKFAVILVHWGDSPPVAGGKSEYFSYLLNPGLGIARYWREQTEGELVMAGDVFGWLALGSASTNYHDDRWPDQKVFARSKIAPRAIALASSQPGWSGDYHGYVVVAAIRPPAGYTVDGGATGTGAGHTAVVNVGDSFDFVAHEVGHVLGLGHSFGNNVYKNATWSQPGEYAHPYCIMSAQAYAGTNPTYTTPDIPTSGMGTWHTRRGPGLGGYLRWLNGWADATLLTVDITNPPAAQTFTLTRLSAGWSAGRRTKILHIQGLQWSLPVGGWTVEYRSNQADYDKGLPEPLLVISGLEDGQYRYFGEVRSGTPHPFPIALPAPLAATPAPTLGVVVELLTAAPDTAELLVSPWPSAVATAFEHADFGGRAARFGEGVHNLAGPTNALATSGFNDVISSFRLDCARLTAYEHIDRQGASRVFHDDTPYVGQLFNDRISSLEIQAGARVYADWRYEGLSAVLVRGFYTADKTPILRSASSFRIPQGLCVRAYTTPEGGKGGTWFTGAVAFVGAALNDRIQSLAVQDAPTLFRHADYRGAWKTLAPGSYGPDELGFGNDAVSSVRVPKFWRVTLYEHADRTGATLVLTADTPFVGAGFNDRASYVEVVHLSFN